MRAFVLQNPDYKEYYFNSEYNWVDIDNADIFYPSELDEDYCLDLRKMGRWVEVDIKIQVADV